STLRILHTLDCGIFRSAPAFEGGGVAGQLSVFQHLLESRQSAPVRVSVDLILYGELWRTCFAHLHKNVRRFAIRATGKIELSDVVGRFTPNMKVSFFAPELLRDTRFNLVEQRVGF